MSEQRITISLSTIVTSLLVVLLLIMLWQLRELVVVVMVSVVLASSIAPIVDWAESLRIPRWLSVVTVYLVSIGGFVGLGLLIGPTVVQQTQRLISSLPGYSESLYLWLQDVTSQVNTSQPDLLAKILNPQDLTNWAIRSSRQVVLRSYDLTRGVVWVVFSGILVLILSAYMVTSSRALIAQLVELFPYPWNERLLEQVKPVSQRMGGFIAGRVIVSLILGVVITVGLKFLGLSEFALALGVIAGFANLVPLVGPVVGAIPALIVALATGGLTWLWVLLLFVIVQNLEGNILTPLVIGSSVKLHPLYVFLAVLGGTQVLGVLGALIVPPWVAGAGVLLDNLYLRPKQMAEASLMSDHAATELLHGDSTAPPDPVLTGSSEVARRLPDNL
ncbi:MAG TPA: AI-2E family transporter [Microcoleaceae cyanobacterium]|jgi:predicted PurR-regulated permease PerM